MATMRDIRRRIKTVRNIQQITKALKMVAAARLQRAESKANAARPYAEEMLAVLDHLASAGGDARHPLLETRPPRNVGILVITSDRGMAGSYNANIIRRASAIVSRYDPQQVKLITIGKKGRMFFAKRHIDIVADYQMPSSEVTFQDARQIGQAVRRMFEQQEVDIVHLVFTRFYTAAKQVVNDMQLLPIAQSEFGDTRQHGVDEDYMFEPRPEVLLSHLLPRYVDTQIYRALLESLASEHGSRMTAMSSATDNAGEMIDRLTLDLNRARQAAITKELAEIVGGADSLQ